MLRIYKFENLTMDNNHNHHHFFGGGSNSNASNNNNSARNSQQHGHEANAAAATHNTSSSHQHHNNHHNTHHNSNHSSSVSAAGSKRQSTTAASNNNAATTDVVMTDLTNTATNNSNATSASPSTIPTWRNYDFKLQSWEAVAFWKWELEVDTCPICRNQIMDLCIECQGKFEGTAPTENEEADCSIAWGICNHAFHMHCISRWLKNRNVCPLDNQTWEYSRIGR